FEALTAWTVCLKAAYDINPIFGHVDKDMAEIAMAKQVWNSTKINLCWWHLRRAVRTRLANGKLATTAYNARRAHAEFDFIDVERTTPIMKVVGQLTLFMNLDQPHPPHQLLYPLLPEAALDPNPSVIPLPATTPLTAILPDAVNTPRIRLPAHPVKHIDLRAMLKSKHGSKKVAIRLVPPGKPAEHEYKKPERR
ncbi:hypothetical protein DXG01_007855, partial [Tephrocybe rancida]